MPGSVIVSSARTPIGKLSGSLASLTAPALGGHAIAAALGRAGLTGEQVDHVILGMVLQAGGGQVPARQAAAKGGVPLTVPSKALNSACLSGMDAIYQADQMIASGDADVVVAGGMESMTAAPYLLMEARAGYRLGDAQMHDAMLHDGLLCAFDLIHMGESTERYAADVASMTREQQDELAAKSHERAASAAKEGRTGEVAPIEVPQRRGEPVLVDADEGIRPGTSTESLGSLRAAFVADGSITAGNASQISDGAAVVVVTSRAKADELGLEPLAELVSFATVAGPDTSLLHQPAHATQRALAKAGLAVGDVDLFEINEAFAAVGLVSMADLGITDEVVNVNGGAIALGHPIGASGARIVLTLVDELRRRGGGLGAASLCGGGGQGEATVVRTL
jgi:acetyl-CoA C-acetyltransferase